MIEKHPGESAATFDSHFDRLTAIVHQRLEIEWQSHKRDDLRRLEPDLLELLREFGALLRVVYRYGLTDALRHEAAWYASTLASRGPGEDAFALLLDSWIVAIQGLIKPPQCNVLAAPLQALRADLASVFAEAKERRWAPASPKIRKLVDRVIAGDLPGARDLLRGHIAAGMPPHEVIPRVILPAMSDIGRCWEINVLAIYEEHLATETIIQLLAGLPAIAPPAQPIHRTGLVSCVPNDHIQILPMALSAYLEMRGWTAPSLGQGLPAEQIALAAQALKPDAVFLSLTMLSRLSDALDVLDRLGRSKPGCPVFVGGRGAEPGRALLEVAGARVTQDFDEAHRLATEGGSLHA